MPESLRGIHGTRGKKQTSQSGKCVQQLLRALTHALKLKIYGICLISSCTLTVAGLLQAREQKVRNERCDSDNKETQAKIHQPDEEVCR